MAQRVQVILEDDLDGGKADETVNFGLDGVEYVIDLKRGNATKLRKALELYVGSGRKVKASKSSRRTPVEDTAKIRKWGRENGYEVSERGRVPAELVQAYRAAS